MLLNLLFKIDHSREFLLRCRRITSWTSPASEVSACIQATYVIHPSSRNQSMYMTVVPLAQCASQSPVNLQARDRFETQQGNWVEWVENRSDTPRKTCATNSWPFRHGRPVSLDRDQITSLELLWRRVDLVASKNTVRWGYIASLIDKVRNSAHSMPIKRVSAEFRIDERIVLSFADGD